MAKPIKETPILTGRDAVTFFHKMQESQNKRVSAVELTRIKTNAERLKSIFK